ncbi:hypothetical protein [Kineosporia sp. NBRC 101731]|uniref:Flp family type IVb pilin n=1 Tax=Kineosporia sp. NBRC 101731 TaxID=3032199 RepID=UPI00249FB48D|nr:hypothetical protein [Kineosporia sp. NBRC 101731]GLY26775.1 hypothetical protein Kisp02_01400 [Kineosporia sp. NBRC 101731]
MKHPGDRGSSAVEYGLIAGGVVVAFLAAFVGLQAIVGEVFGRAVTQMEKVEPLSTPAEPAPGSTR